MNISKVLDSNAGSIFISVLLGLGLAALFRSVCNDGKCIVIQGPSTDEIKRNYYKINDECFKYTPVYTECDSS